MCLEHVASGSDSHSSGTQGMYYDRGYSSNSDSRNLSYFSSSESYGSSSISY